jgi:hypothetical protein
MDRGVAPIILIESELAQLRFVVAKHVFRGLPHSDGGELYQKLLCHLRARSGTALKRMGDWYEVFLTSTLSSPMQP